MGRLLLWTWTPETQLYTTHTHTGPTLIQTIIHTHKTKPWLDISFPVFRTLLTSPPITIRLLLSDRAAYNLTIRDLLPNKTYHFQLFVHNASAPSIVWHWRPVGERVACATQAASAYCALRRADNTPSCNRLVIAWDECGRAGDGPPLRAASLHFARLGKAHRRGHEGLQGWEFSELSSPTHMKTKLAWQSSALRSTQKAALLTKLQEDSAYAVRLRLDSEHGGPSFWSEAILLRTAAPGTTYTEMYRVSEYTQQPDFLWNHNSASRQASSAFLTATNDGLFFNATSPVARYCVAHVDPQTVGGWADYASCNGPEANPRNRPDDPVSKEKPQENLGRGGRRIQC